jgi:D-sedoheptulose 7-phosphate isomerase
MDRHACAGYEFAPLMNQHVHQLIHRYPILEPCGNSIQAALELLVETYQEGGKLLVCGNGGSAADSEHIVGELMKGFMKKRGLSSADRQRLIDLDCQRGATLADSLQGSLPAIALTGHVALASAIANDNGAEMIFAQQVHGLGQPGDTLLGLSTSGNSGNVLNAFLAAKLRHVSTVALTGAKPSPLSELADVTVQVPSDNTPEVQELHLPIYHALCIALEDHFFAH